MAATSESDSGSGLLDLRGMGLPAGGDGAVVPDGGRDVLPMAGPAGAGGGAAYDFDFHVDRGTDRARVRLFQRDVARRVARHLPEGALPIWQPDGSLAVVELAAPGRVPASWRR